MLLDFILRGNMKRLYSEDGLRFSRYSDDKNHESCEG